jgi:hypothetical protein
MARADLAEQDDADGNDESLDLGEAFGEAFDVGVLSAKRRGELAECPSAIPLPGQERLVARAIDQARAAGLHLPEDELRVVWKEGRPGVSAGCVRRVGDGPVDVYLSVNAWPHDLQRTTFHELQHVHDLLAGRTFDDRLAMERRAEAFALRMMREASPW